MFLMYTGALRVSEVVNLKVENIEFDMGPGFHHELEFRKNKPNGDIFFLSAEALDRIKAYMKAKGIVSGYLFPGRGKSGHLTTRQVQNIAKEAGITDKLFRKNKKRERTH